jgi:hypothetical protein
LPHKEYIKGIPFIVSIISTEQGQADLDLICNGEAELMTRDGMEFYSPLGFGARVEAEDE